MSTAARLGLEEETQTVQKITASDAATIDLTQTPVVVSEPSPSTVPEVADDPTDDPAMLFVYIGTVMLLTLLAVAAVLALA